MDKNSITEKMQNKNRETAASNAARCLVQFMNKAPLRRQYRGALSPFDAKMPQRAMEEAEVVSKILARYGIKVIDAQLYTCLFGRRGPIPAYYHWRQKSEALHWIDFKILTAIRALPRNIVTPVPLVKIAARNVNFEQPWRESVYRLLDTDPIIDEQMKAQYEATSNSGIHTGSEQKNMIDYMLGQFCHRRMFVFTWQNDLTKWEELYRAFGTWFAIFDWKTMELAGKGGKQDAPGIDLLIEPGSYTSLNGWLATYPPPEVVKEFVEHFKCHQDLSSQSPSNSQGDAKEQLKALMLYWDAEFFSKK